MPVKRARLRAESPVEKRKPQAKAFARKARLGIKVGKKRRGGEKRNQAVAPPPLSDRDNRRIARLQFRPLPRAQRNLVEKIRAKQQGTQTAHVSVSSNDLESVFQKRPGEKPQGSSATGKALHVNINPGVVTEYLKCICRYRNKNDDIHRPADVPSCAAATLVGELELARRHPHRDMLTGKEPRKNKHLDDIRQNLQAANAYGGALFDADYIFILVLLKRWGHWFLLGCAPKQGAAFIIDSAYHPGSLFRYNSENFPLRELMALLFECCLEAPDKISRLQWPLYTQWAFEAPKDGSPPCRIQGDDHNCGVYTLTNAMCLAFGYDIMCIKSKYMDAGKRPRVVAELCSDGFEAPFDYQLLPIPETMKRTYMTDLGKRFLEDEAGDPYDETDKEEWQRVEGQEEEEEEEEGGWVHVNRPSADDDGLIKGNRDWRNPRLPGEKRRPKKRAPRDSNEYGARKTKLPVIKAEPEGNKVPGSEEDWHAPFNPRLFWRDGFLHEVANQRYADVKTKTALKQKCREDKIKGYSWWSRLDIRVFRMWMENVMEGRERARREKDEEDRARREENESHGEGRGREEEES